MTPEAFAAAAGVSRETLARLERYAATLRTWQARINLVGHGTLDDLWRRHFLDSAQLAPFLPPGAETLVDLGSGAGFPGLVLAILAPRLNVHLVEADARKAAFLIEAARAAAAPVKVHAVRAEALAGRLTPADVITARAVAPLDRLLDLAAPLLKPAGVCLFLKGARAAAELDAARKRWRFIAEQHVSVTDPSGRIVELRRLTPVLRK